MNKLIIAVAGSGKTTHLVKEALKCSGRILITTYTESNASELHKKFIEIAGRIPGNVTIQTWWSFLLQHGVRPYQSFLIDDTISGLLLVNSASAIRFKGKFGPVFYPEDDVRKHFFSPSMAIYSDKIAKFVIRINELSSGAIFTRLSQIYPTIFIDEIQDLAGYDLEIVKFLLAGHSRILLVGDPRQVTYLTHNEKKYGKYANGGIVSFIEKECKKSCEVDLTTLKSSYRNNTAICQLSSLLYPKLPQAESAQHEVTGHDGIFVVSRDILDEYLQKYDPVQLRYDVRTQGISTNHKAYNFGDSKGLTFERVVIFATADMLSWLKSNSFPLKNETRAKFYVALTRAKYSVAIVSNDGIQHPAISRFQK